jgi:hypothetical protein
LGTFHPHAHALHGITCVATTRGGACWVGRVDTVDERGVVLLDADGHDPTTTKEPQGEWLARAARVGVWPRHPRVALPAGDVVDLRPLREVAAGR